MEKIKVNHPDMGYVVFTEPTVRQKHILKEYNNLSDIMDELTELDDTISNDMRFGGKVREILDRYYEYKKLQKNN